MLAVEKTHRINIEFNGLGSGKVADLLRKAYPKIEITEEDDEELVSSDDSEWYRSMVVTPGDYLKIRRENAGMTQKELSDRTGIAVPNLSAMESGKRQIGAASAKKLAAALDCAVSNFLA